MNSHFEVRIAKTIGYGNLMVRLALYVSIVCLTISIVFLIFSGNDVHRARYSTFVWYALLVSLWILMVSAVYLLLATIYGQLSENRRLESLTKEFILLIINIFVAGIFVMMAYQMSS